MNKEQMLEMKKAYEANLVLTLAQALGFKEEEIKAEWSLEKAIITITNVTRTTTNHYTFVAENNNVLLTMLGVKTHSVNGTMIAFEALPMSIDTQTLNAITHMIMEVLNSDPMAIPKIDTMEVTE